MSKLETVVITNKNGMSVTICNLGARITSITLNIDHRPTEMTVGYANLEDYIDDSFYLGATCGRVCNRISNAQFSLNDTTYHLSQNDGDNCLHGGVDNFANRLWLIDKNTLNAQQVTLSLTSHDGDQGFPANVKISVNMALTESNQLIIQYHGISDAPTPINLTNHTYFNLGEQTCASLLLTLNSSYYLETNPTNTPTGNILSVEQTDFEFREENCIGVSQQHLITNAVNSCQGFDHCMVIDTPSLATPPLAVPCAVLTSKLNNIKMSLFTDQAALQLYTGSYLSNEFQAYQGVCLEAQGFPDAVNFAHFPSTILHSGENYRKTIIYQFEATKRINLG